MDWKKAATKTTMVAWADSDWAGCKASRKSTTGGAIMIDGHLIKAFSSTQAVIALSSGEAELYAMVKTASQGTGAAAMAADFGEELELELYSDSRAATGIAYRQGLRKVRHIQVQQHWIQQKVLKKQIKLQKVLGTENIADVMTKHVPEDLMKIMLDKMGIQESQGRAESAPAMMKSAGDNSGEGEQHRSEEGR